MENFCFDKFFSEPLDYSLLPQDCPAVAAERIRRSYNLRGSCNTLDLRIVLGDITKGVSSDFFERN